MNKLTTPAFEKLFRSLVPNFKEAKLTFAGRKDGQVRVSFVRQGKFVYLDLYRTELSLAPWVGHFIHFFNTGKLDMTTYWMAYTSSGEYLAEKTFTGETLRAKLGIQPCGEIDEHTDSWNNMMVKARSGNMNLGFQMISRPQ